MSFPTNDNLMAQLIQNGYSGDINTALVRYLRAQYALTGGQYNDLLFYHLGQLGYTGSLNDRIRQWDGTLFSPLALFAAGEKGVWYDPSDLTSMFQDSAGTTAAVVGQPVGLVLDKSQGLVLGPELFTSTAGWTLGTGWSADGTTISYDGTDAGNSAITNITLVSGRLYRISVSVSMTVAGRLNIRRDATATEQFHVDVPGDYSFTMLGTGSELRFTVGAAPRFTGTVSNISVREIPGYHATQATSTARPVLQQDANGKYYLAFDGTDDFLVTSAIDFSGTDKMSVFAGVRKLSDAARGMFLELGITAPVGSFFIDIPDLAGNTRIGFGGDGGKGLVSNPSSAAPITFVFSAMGDRAGVTAVDEHKIRYNGVEEQTQINAGGLTGNYSNLPLYIGMRAGTSLPFNGHLYSLVVRGALSDAAQIAAAESYVNSKTGAF